ncbi:hypothetical protein ASPVEDRAFT_656491 [Aspergillus versicolor CBS 583.65]|uniref:SH3 domain-containing protein n=1 Tax=Aspergillus versicolor CBS 583.65 TaxID=1036611 RepID=A0A1L9PKY2_ASPVE|nr:uncharacterized protein ASPVEDRAFT_656491 [Aspergillus versicolor CBS 583.65]OJJ02143.1 hypothetical protein ASPVEDRAFT_656491 [Aspergillus versicolor CBS 583.65]
MQSVQRQFGRFMKRSADESQVALLLSDFDQIDKLLDKIVDSTRAWRDAWSSLLTHQDRLFTEFEGLYAPIIGSSEATSHTPVPTPEATLARSSKIRVEYEDLKKDLFEQLNGIDERMIDPASQAKELLTPLKKTIKKRQDKKLDYERHTGRVDSYSKKTKRTDRENASLAKAEDDLTRSTEEYHAADEHLRKCLPPLIAAVFSLLPRLLAAQIEIQNNLLANYYTVIYGYCDEEQFPANPPQELNETVTEWEQACNPVKEQIESFGCIVNGKTARSNSQPSNERRPSNTLTSLNNRFRSNQNVPTQQSQSDAGLGAMNDSKPSLGIRSKSTPYASSVHSAQSLYKDTASGLSSSSVSETPTPSQQGSQSDSLTPSIPLSTKPSLSAIAGQKKPPPPPPKPRSVSSNAIFVTALYDFGGQSAGDLAFQEGDRIRVVKRTDSTDDWWDGELHGVRGSFPANYVE